MKLQLFRNGKEIIASDGVMYVDGRLSLLNIIKEVHSRNERMKNFPHKIANAFAICNKGNIYGTVINLLEGSI